MTSSAVQEGDWFPHRIICTSLWLKELSFSMGKTRLKPSAEWTNQLSIINNQLNRLSIISIKQLQQSLGSKAKLDAEQSSVSYGNKVAEKIKASQETINHIDQ